MYWWKKPNSIKNSSIECTVQSMSYGKRKRKKRRREKWLLAIKHEGSHVKSRGAKASGLWVIAVEFERKKLKLTK